MNRKKTIRIITCIFMAILLCQGVVGCTQKKTKQPNMEWIYDVDGSDYSIGEWRDNYYLVFDNLTKYYTDETVFSIRFTSVKEMKERLIQGTLTDEQKKQGVKLSGSDRRLQIFDLDQVYDAVLPQNIKVAFVAMTGTEYEIYLTFTENITPTASISYLDEDSYREAFVRGYRNTFGIDNSDLQRMETLDDSGKRVLYGRYSYHVRYQLTRGEETVIVDKRYPINTSETVDEERNLPERVTMYCRQGDIYYTVELGQFTEVPTDEWLLQIGLTKYEQ